MLKKRIIPVQLLLNNRLVKTKSFDKYIDVGNVAIDLFDVAHFSYHRSFAFSVIADSTKGSLVKGGSYEVLENVPAVGASFYLENLL